MRRTNSHNLFTLPLALLLLVACAPQAPNTSPQALSSVNLTVFVSGSGAGTVKDVGTNGSIVNCDQVNRLCPAAITDASVTLRAVPTDDSSFIAWGGDCAVTTVDPDCTILSSDATAVAYFRNTTVAAGAFFTCGLKSDGTTRCWGQNDNGQLGDGSRYTNADGTVRTVSSITNFIVDISAGAYHACGLSGSDGSVWCWGSNAHGQVGVVSSSDTFSTPSRVGGLAAPAVAIAAGGYHTCALLVDRKVACWGLNDDGQVDSSNMGGDVKTPRTVPVIAGAKAITAGAYHSCALLVNNTVQCWGYNRDGELGVGSPDPDGFDPHGLGAGPVTFFADSVSGSVIRIAGSVGAGTLAGNIQLGGFHSCALHSGGQVNCWGFGQDGQLNGSDMGSQFLAFTAPNIPSPAKAIAAGGYHSCAVGNDNLVYCWGNDNWAQLGSGVVRYGAQTTTLVNGIRQARMISAGSFHTCAVIAKDDIRCWGRNDWGQVGTRGGLNSTITSPTMPPF